MRTLLKKFLRAFPPIRKLEDQRNALLASQAFGPGHYYSPLPSHDDIRKRSASIFNRDKRALPGIDLNEAGQLQRLDQVLDACKDWPFPTAKGGNGCRYYSGNGMFDLSDAAFLYGMLKVIRPRRFIEVGSGFSSAVALDTNDLHFGGSMQCTFIEPYPERLLSLLRPADHAHVKLIAEPVQSVPLDTFTQLDSGDVLFIDSSHVSKVGSDVNRLFFEVLPLLKSGTWVHIHDIFYPFEYPQDWVMGGRSWNEDYLVRAFLMFNTQFSIELFSNFLQLFHADRFTASMPQSLQEMGGSLWLRKT